ncbi:hypothetical protein [Clostridium sp.]|uniref:hypothetical protein n=1 Tax=Clostridium sp. TaxID=1506 RepID=UPI00321635ED
MEKKKRGFWTTLMLVLYIIGGVFSIIAPFTNELVKEFTPELALGTGQLIYSAISGVILIAITIGIFMWKKVAIYVLGVYQAISFIISLIITPFTWYGLVGGLVGLGIVYLIVSSLLKKIKYNEEIEQSMNV